MIMASTHRQVLETVLVEKPRWKRGNIAFIDPAEPLMIRNGREHYLYHWDNPHYDEDGGHFEVETHMVFSRRSMGLTRTMRGTERAVEEQGIGQKTI